MEQRSTPSLASAMTWTVGLRLMGLPLQLGVFVLIARIHDLADVGVYAIANAVWQMFKGLGPLGLDVVAMRFGGELLSSDRHADVGAIEIASTRAVLLANSVMASILVAVGLVVSGQRVTFAPSVVLIIGIGIPVFALMGLQVGQLRARNLVRAAQIPESLVFNALAGALIALAWALGRGLIQWTLAATVVSACVVVGLNAARFRRLHDRATPPLAKALRTAVTRSAVHMFTGQALITAGARSGPILVGAIAGANAAGLFEAAARLGQLASVSTWAAGVAASPLLAAANAAGDRRRLQGLVTAASWFAFGPAVAVVVGVVVLGRILLRLFGGPFVEAYPAAILISIASAINAAGGLSATALYMTGREKMVVILTSLSVLALVVSMIVLVPLAGLPGAGIALVVSALVRDGGASALLPHALHVKPGVFSVAGFREFQQKAASALSAAFVRKG